MEIAKELGTTLIFYRFLLTLPEVILAGCKSFWKPERTLCKWGPCTLAMFPVKRLGLGKHDFFQKLTCVSFISGLIFNFFYWYFSVSFEVKNEKVELPFFPLPSLCFLSRQRKIMGWERSVVLLSFRTVDLFDQTTTKRGEAIILHLFFCFLTEINYQYCVSRFFDENWSNNAIYLGYILPICNLGMFYRNLNLNYLIFSFFSFFTP